MANEQNLTPFGTVKDARENGRKGGIKSGEVRREKATMRKLLEQMLNEKAKNGQTYKELATLGLIRGAVKGDARNYKVMLETLGEYNGQEERKDGIILDLVEALNNAKNNK